MTTYGSDSTCTSSPGTIHNTYNASDFNEAGDLYSFNCIGEDNYAENHIYQSDDSCCGSSYTISFAATNVCVKNAADGTYSMGICNSNTTTSYKYNTSQCGTINDGIVQGTTYDYQCVSIMNQWTPIYTRMDKCILNGTIFDESKFCHTTTATPTLPTISPTYKPTISPTYTPTKYPIVKPTNNPIGSKATNVPTNNPIYIPTLNPILPPYKVPTYSPISISTKQPTNKPTNKPIKPPTNDDSDSYVIKPFPHKSWWAKIEPVSSSSSSSSSS
eukprot:877417_1